MSDSFLPFELSHSWTFWMTHINYPCICSPLSIGPISLHSKSIQNSWVLCKDDKIDYRTMSIFYSFLYPLNPMMDLDSLKDSKSPNPQWGSNKKCSRIMIASPFVNIHFVSLPLCTVLYVDIVPPHIICYNLISHTHASLSFVYYSMFYHSILYLSITGILHHVLISLLYLLLVCLLL